MHLLHLIAMVPGAEVVESAWGSIIEVGAIGGVLVIILGAFLAMVNKQGTRGEKRFDRFEERFDQLREDEEKKAERVNGILKDKDDRYDTMNTDWAEKLEKANEKSNKIAIDAVKGLTLTSERQTQLMGLVEDMLKLLRKNGHDKSSDA